MRQTFGPVRKEAALSRRLSISRTCHWSSSPIDFRSILWILRQGDFPKKSQELGKKQKWGQPEACYVTVSLNEQNQWSTAQFCTVIRVARLGGFFWGPEAAEEAEEAVEAEGAGDALGGPKVVLAKSGGLGVSKAWRESEAAAAGEAGRSSARLGRFASSDALRARLQKGAPTGIGQSEE